MCNKFARICQKLSIAEKTYSTRVANQIGVDSGVALVDAPGPPIGFVLRTLGLPVCQVEFSFLVRLARRYEK